MSAYAKAQQMGLTGEPAEQVAVLHTLTVSDIPVKSVRTWFREKNLWLERSTGEMFGTLQTAYASASQEAKVGLDYLYDTVFAGSAEFLRTTQPVWAVKVFQLVQLVVALSPAHTGLVDSFYALDGGRPYKDLTVEAFQAQQVEAEAIAQKQALRSRIDAAWNQIGTSEQAEAIAEFRAIADELEAG